VSRSGWLFGLWQIGPHASLPPAMTSRTDIAAAAARISGQVRPPPVLDLTPAELGLGFPLTLKLELPQLAGSFKPRGPFNRLLPAELPAAGVIAASGGNHVAATVLVSDDAIGAAQRLLWDRLRLIAEPGGAPALAPLLSGAFAPPDGARAGVLVCGANTDPAKASVA
jgi:threonine dehydratase